MQLRRGLELLFVVFDTLSNPANKPHHSDCAARKDLHYRHSESVCFDNIHFLPSETTSPPLEEFLGSTRSYQ